MLDKQQFHDELKKLADEKRWQEAYDLLQGHEKSHELAIIRARVEAELGLRPLSDIQMLEYIKMYASIYNHEAIIQKLLTVGHSGQEITRAFQELGLSIAYPFKREEWSYKKQDTLPLWRIFLLSFGLFLITAFIMVFVFHLVLVATCAGGFRI